MGSMASEIRTPIILGLIVLQDSKHHPWSNQELQLVNWVSIQLSINMLHNQSLSRIQSLVEERTSQLKWSLDVQAKLSEKMRQQLEELQQLNKLKDDFLSSMSHELNTPLTTMKIAIKMLRQPYCTPERQTKYLDILEQEWNREYNLIKDLLTLQQVETNRLNTQPQEVSLDKIIDKLSENFTKKWSSNKGLTLSVTYNDETKKNKSSADNLQVYIDPYTLEQIIGELLLNAGKYADTDTKVEIFVTKKMNPEGYQIILTITNYGWGISPEEQRYIFDKFRRGKGATDNAIPGTGLGLTMVKSLVDHLEGTIEVTSTPLENSPTFRTSFTVTLPQSF
jgi:signal transduction histidine kinase